MNLDSAVKNDVFSAQICLRCTQNFYNSSLLGEETTKSNDNSDKLAGSTQFGILCLAGSPQHCTALARSLY